MYDTIVVPPAWVEARLDTLCVVDVRDAWEFDGIGHLPGAMNVPFDEFRSESGDAGMLPGADVWESLLSAAGIDPDDDVVAYDDTHGVFAARFLVTAALYGHPPDRLHLLDGDFSAWNREYGTTTGSPAPPESAYAVSEPESSPLVDYDTIRAALDDPEAVLVDTREAWEFEEHHLPGAVNLDWRDLVDDDTRGLKPRDELAGILADVDLTPDTRVLLYCNTARRISHTYVVLRWLGYDDVGFYEGSLTEWVDRGGPMEGSEAGD